MVEKTVDVNPSAGGTRFVSVATALPVKGWLDVVRLLRMNSKVEAQLRKSEGLIRYGLKTDIPHKRFWTLSVWGEREAMRRFVAAEPHLTATRLFSRWAAARGAAFVEWENSDGKIDWGDAMERLEAPTRRYPK